MSLINIQNLSFGYDGGFENVFENVNLQIDTAWKLGLTGRNGRGKTTLLRLLMGDLEYTGKIVSSVDFEYFPYAPDNSYLTIDAIHEISPQAEDWQIQRELGFLEAEDELLYRPFDTLSNGEQTKVLIAGMFLRENSFLLIDEPTNHLDTHARDVLASYLKRKEGFILVSHDREFLDSCIDHILAINKMNIEVQKGNFSSWNENRERQEQFEQAQNERLKREINQLEQASKNVSSWSDKTESSKYSTRNSGLRPDRGYIGHKSAKLMKRVKTMESRIEKDISEKNKLLQNVDEAPPLKLLPLKYHSSKLITFQNVSLSYDSKTVFSDISFTVAQGDRIAICGQNGSGKTSLIKLIIDELDYYSGTITRAANLKISYVCQSTDGLFGDLDDYAEKNQVDKTLFKAILRKLDFSRELFSRPIESYSQGQKKKVMLARSLSEQAHLYIWDEPLNYIDVLSRIQIEELLKASEATLLFVEHDKRFCEQVATKQIYL
ncbi:MAG: ABC-F type ribosomal protection protein [Acetatifactor sp.]|nr:ABC-F type ribosomal protection protein [Acetatifactor sp.]